MTPQPISDGPPRDVVSLEELRRLTAAAGLPITAEQAAALAELVNRVGGVHRARLALEAVDALRDAA